MPTEPFDFTGADGQRLSGRLERPEGGPARAWALFAHCFTCSKTSVAASRISRALAALGVGVLRFDFTGLGESEGEFAASTFSGSVRDLHAARDAMAAAGTPPSLLIGHSLGGAAVLAAAGDMAGVAAVATLAAPFDVQQVTELFGADGLQAIEETGEAEVRLDGRPFMVRKAFIDDLRAQDQAERIGHLRRALLILHAPIDRTVDVENATRIFMAARHPKSFVSLDHADHLLTRPADAAYAAGVIAAWASRYLPDAPAAAAAAADPGVVEVETTGAGKFQVRVKAGGATFLADEPVSMGGLASGPTPYELFSAGLGACTAMTLRLYAELKGWPLAGVKVGVTHSKAADRTPPDLFTREIELTGDLDPGQRARMMAIADRCPVHRTIEGGSKVETLAAGGPLTPEDPADHARDMARACADG
ncbi:alpha/beta fold hydrolase [Phenylobacterium sp.]|jgi:putative redox protein|uniref:bifunctional alpha/beta hydrolase/OsmC family protein n=1 Tax=Phenylobacterium sp. TaxID=1871053 RepID=UPI002F3FAB23